LSRTFICTSVSLIVRFPSARNNEFATRASPGQDRADPTAHICRLMSLACCRVTHFSDTAPIPRELTVSPKPSMRRPVSVKSVFLFPPRFFLRLSRAASVAILPSALFVERLSLGARWVFSFQWCCYLIIDLGSHRFNGSWARTWVQSPELGGSARLFRSHSTPRRLRRCGCSAVAHRLPRSPTTCVTVRPTSGPPQRRLVSWHSFLPARLPQHLMRFVLASTQGLAVIREFEGPPDTLYFRDSLCILGQTGFGSLDKVVGVSGIRASILNSSSWLGGC
jgi:hypothetical protein